MIQITTALLLSLCMPAASLSASPGGDEPRYVPLPQKRVDIAAKDLRRVVPPPVSIPPPRLLSQGPKCRLYYYRTDLNEKVYEMSVKRNPTTGKDNVKAYLTSSRGQSWKGILLGEQDPTDDCPEKLLETLKNEAWSNYIAYSKDDISIVQKKLTPRIHAQLDKEYKDVWITSTTSDRVKSSSVTNGYLTTSIMVGYMERVFNKATVSTTPKCSFSLPPRSLQKPLTLNLGPDFTIHSIESNLWNKNSPVAQTTIQQLRGYYPKDPASGIPDPTEDAPFHELVDTLCKQTFVEYLKGFLERQGKNIEGGVYEEDDMKGSRGSFTIKEGSKMAQIMTKMEMFIKEQVDYTANAAAISDVSPPPVPPRMRRRIDSH